jgi:hypothetical protein
MVALLHMGPKHNYQTRGHDGVELVAIIRQSTQLARAEKIKGRYCFLGTANDPICREHPSIPKVPLPIGTQLLAR